MKKNDLSAITRDKLYFLLSSAKNEMVKYTNCIEEVEWCERRIGQLKNDVVQQQQHQKQSTFSIIGGIGLAILMLYLCSESTKEGVILFLLFFGGGAALLLIHGLYYLNSSKRKEKIAQEKIEEFEEALPDLRKKAEESFDKFFTTIEPYEFPRDYWYEYAINKMLKFVEIKQADNWKEVVCLYEEHLHRMRLEENAQQTLDEIKRQSDEIQRGSNASRWAAAGAWASAAGIWLRR